MSHSAKRLSYSPKYLVFFMVLFFSLPEVNGQGIQGEFPSEKDCSRKNLEPYLYAHMCLPFRPMMSRKEKRVVCDNYELVHFGFTLPKTEVVVSELAKCEEQALRKLYESLAKETGREDGFSLHSKEERTLVLSDGQGNWVIHSFRSPYGWPYHLEAKVKADQAYMEKVKYYIESLDFGSTDREF